MVITAYAWASTEPYTNIKPTFHHHTEHEVQTRLSWMGMGICHAREEQEFSRN